MSEPTLLSKYAADALSALIAERDQLARENERLREQQREYASVISDLEIALTVALGETHAR